MMAPPDQNREFPFFKITAKNDHDFRDQHKILVLEMLTNPGEEMATKILLHSVRGQTYEYWNQLGHS